MLQHWDIDTGSGIGNQSGTDKNGAQHSAYAIASRTSVGSSAKMDELTCQLGTQLQVESELLIVIR